MIRALHRHVRKVQARKALAAFEAGFSDYDQRIEAARAAHQPVNHLIEEKRAAIHKALQAGVSVQGRR